MRHERRRLVILITTTQYNHVEITTRTLSKHILAREHHVHNTNGKTPKYIDHMDEISVKYTSFSTSNASVENI